MEMGQFTPSNQGNAQNFVSVRYNNFNQPGNHAGKTVGQIRSELGNLWSIPSDATAFVNDKKVDAEYKLAPGDKLMYHRKTGDKGGR